MLDNTTMCIGQVVACCFTLCNLSAQHVQLHLNSGLPYGSAAAAAHFPEGAPRHKGPLLVTTIIHQLLHPV